MLIFAVVNKYYMKDNRYPEIEEEEGIKEKSTRTSFFCLLIQFCFSRNFVRNRRISLYKGSLEDWGKTGLRIGDRTQFHILPPKGRSVALQSAINCIKEHPMMSQQPYYDSSSGAKVIILFEWTKSIHIFLFWACSSLTMQIVASFVAPARKVRIRLRPITQWQCDFKISSIL